MSQQIDKTEIHLEIKMPDGTLLKSPRLLLPNERRVFKLNIEITDGQDDPRRSALIKRFEDFGYIPAEAERQAAYEIAKEDALKQEK